MLSHNVLGVKGWTVKFRPWELLFQEAFENKPAAMKREKELKTAAGRRYIHERLSHLK